jgi:anti-sigma regulatory factor (Ser/Thr protein kinase)
MSGSGHAATSTEAGFAIPLEGVGSHRRSLMAAPDAGAAARRQFDDVAGHVEKDVIDRSHLVLTELVANSVKHAGLGRDQQIDLGLSVLTELVRIEVRDEGRGFEPMPARPDPEQESGWGLFLVDQLTDRWGIDPGPGTRVWCELDRPSEHGRRRPGPMRMRQRAQRESARPLEFDESGFPIPQRAPGFVERVARLLEPY